MSPTDQSGACSDWWSVEISRKAPRPQLELAECVIGLQVSGKGAGRRAQFLIKGQEEDGLGRGEGRGWLRECWKHVLSVAAATSLPRGNLISQDLGVSTRACRGLLGGGRLRCLGAGGP